MTIINLFFSEISYSIVISEHFLMESQERSIAHNYKDMSV